MFGKNLKSFFSSTVLISICFSTLIVFPQDMVASDDILTGGASVFVFRKSRKEPQLKATGRAMRNPAAKSRYARHRYDAELAANRKRRVAQSKENQALLARNRARQQQAARLAQSNTLTAKADVLLESKQTDQAIATYREALKSNPKNDAARSGLSEALVVKGIDAAGDANDMSGAMYFEEAVTLDPNNDVAYAKLGDIYNAANDPNRARLNYEKALQINPELTTLYVPVGISYLNAGEIAKAETALQNAEKHGVSDAEFYNLQGMVLYKQNRNDEALAAFDRALSMDRQNATAKYYRANLLDRMNQPDQSVAAYRETVATAPDYAPAWFDLGVVSYNRGDYATAEKSYREAIRIDPDYYQAHANLASTLRQLERYSEANAEYKLAEVGIKDNPDLYSEWGYCLGKTNEWDKSVVRLEQARKLSPDAVDDTNVGWGYYNAAQVDKQNKKDADANAKLQKGKESLQTAVQKNPRLDAAYMNLGSTNNALGDFAAAVAALNIALNLRSNWVIAINQLGLGYRGLNNLPAAIQQFNRVVALDANNVSGLFNLGAAQYAIGDKKGAKKTQERLRKIDPTIAGRLDNILNGKAVIDETKRKIESKVPKLPKFPF